jgi:hypothetical protein
MYDIRIIFSETKASSPLFGRKRQASISCLACRLFFKDHVVDSQEILNLNYVIDDGRFEYSSKIEEQISVQACLAYTSSEFYSKAGVETQTCF